MTSPAFAASLTVLVVVWVIAMFLIIIIVERDRWGPHLKMLTAFVIVSFVIMMLTA